MAGDAQGKPRPALFRALGADDPPPSVEIAGRTFYRLEIYKHDSWAATALYGSGDDRIVCKFNRQKSILGMPMGWLGRWLARREADHYARLADHPNVPRAVGPVYRNGLRLKNAFAHDFVAGHPLRSGEMVDDRFFPELLSLLDEMHRRRMAYVDLHKRENIIVAEDGRPFLVDFQVSLTAPESSWAPIRRWFVRQLQRADRYHLLKHQVRHRPGEFGQAGDEDAHRPWWIRIHRFFAVPLRECRRRLLVLLGVRKSKGRATTEHFAEDAVRRERDERRAA